MTSGKRTFVVVITIIASVAMAMGFGRIGYCDPNAAWSPDNDDGNRMLAWIETSVRNQASSVPSSEPTPPAGSSPADVAAWLFDNYAPGSDTPDNVNYWTDIVRDLGATTAQALFKTIVDNMGKGDKFDDKVKGLEGDAFNNALLVLAADKLGCMGALGKTMDNATLVAAIFNAFARDAASNTQANRDFWVNVFNKVGVQNGYNLFKTILNPANGLNNQLDPSLKGPARYNALLVLAAAKLGNVGMLSQVLTPTEFATALFNAFKVGGSTIPPAYITYWANAAGKAGYQNAYNLFKTIINNTEAFDKALDPSLSGPARYNAMLVLAAAQLGNVGALKDVLNPTEFATALFNAFKVGGSTIPPAYITYWANVAGKAGYQNAYNLFKTIIDNTENFNNQLNPGLDGPARYNALLVLAAAKLGNIGMLSSAMNNQDLVTALFDAFAPGLTGSSRDASIDYWVNVFNKLGAHTGANLFKTILDNTGKGDKFDDKLKGLTGNDFNNAMLVLAANKLGNVGVLGNVMNNQDFVAALFNAFANNPASNTQPNRDFWVNVFNKVGSQNGYNLFKTILDNTGNGDKFDDKLKGLTGNDLNNAMLALAANKLGNLSILSTIMSTPDLVNALFNAFARSSNDPQGLNRAYWVNVFNKVGAYNACRLFKTIIDNPAFATQLGNNLSTGEFNNAMLVLAANKIGNLGMLTSLMNNQDLVTALFNALAPGSKNDANIAYWVNVFNKIGGQNGYNLFKTILDNTGKGDKFDEKLRGLTGNDFNNAMLVLAAAKLGVLGELGKVMNNQDLVTALFNAFARSSNDPQGQNRAYWVNVFNKVGADIGARLFKTILDNIGPFSQKLGNAVTGTDWNNAMVALAAEKLGVIGALGSFMSPQELATSLINAFAPELRGAANLPFWTTFFNELSSHSGPSTAAGTMYRILKDIMTNFGAYNTPAVSRLRTTNPFAWNGALRDRAVAALGITID